MKSFRSSHVDLAIIGGGINGAGLAAQAVRAGLSVALFEKGDFGSGTSSKSTKLIHGGIRYLEQGRFSLVFEALHERYRLMKMAPHLVHPIAFLLPVYEGDKRPAWLVKTGLWIYDFLAGTKNIAEHKWFSPTQALQIAPELKSEGLVGCGLYHDAQVNDARLVLENILSAENNGAYCFNYCRVTQIDRQPSLNRIFYRHETSGEKDNLTCSCLVNASGPWANQTSKLISRNTTPLVRPTRGTHIVVPKILPSHAVLVMSRKDDRITFIIPWRGESLVGTTDLDDNAEPDKVQPTAEEMNYLLQEAARIFPGISWQQKDILSAFAGLRPLAWSDGDRASSISREDKILADGNVFTIVGGKLTTYHSMAQKTLKMILKVLHRKSGLLKSNALPGAPAKSWDLFLTEEIPNWVSTYGINKDQAGHLSRLYGQKGEAVLNLAKKDPRLFEPLSSSGPDLLAQVAYAVYSEKAMHLEDVLLRRLEIGYSKERWGEAPEKASRLMAELLHWDESNRLKELEQYRQKLFPPVLPKS